MLITSMGLWNFSYSSVFPFLALLTFIIYYPSITMHSQQAEESHSAIHPAAAPPLPIGRPHNAQRRRSAQRVFLKDRPEAICQLQISEINKLSEQLAAYKNQYRTATAITSEQDPQRLKGHSFHSRPANVDHTLKNIMATGEAYRTELLAAQEKRTHEARQGAAIQRQIDVFSRERETLTAEFTNEKSKNSILEQEIFMVRDAFQKYKGKADAERHEHLQEIKALRVNCNGLEMLVKDLSVKAGLLPMYEQRINEGEYKFGLLSQQLMQVRGELRYFQQKSTYFESNYNVLNQNFNNLYNTNLNISSELNESKAAYAKLEATSKTLEQECKLLTSKCFDLSEEKHRLTGQLNNQIAMLSERIKGEVKSTDRTERFNEQLALSLDQIKRVARDLEAKNGHLERQIQNKSTIIHGQRMINEQLQSSLKDLEVSLAKREELWKNVLANQIVKLSNQSHEKTLTISAQLVKSQENAKVMSLGLTKSEQQLQVLKEKASSLQKQLNTAYIHLKQKEYSHNTLKEHYEHAKMEILTLQNSIRQYESRLSTAMSVQEQITANSKATNEQKTAKIKDLQAKVQHLSAENVRLQLHGKDLLEEISKLTQISTMLRGELEISQQEADSLEEQFKNEGKKSAWLGEQNRIKEEIISKYNSVAEEMRTKITAYYNDITELTDRNALLEDDVSQTKIQIQQQQAEIAQKAKVLEGMAFKLQENIQHAQKLKAIIAGQINEKAQLIQKNKEIILKTFILLEKLTKSQNQFNELQTAFKETVEMLLLKQKISTEKLKQQHRATLYRIERTSQQEKQQKSQKIEALNQQIAPLQTSLESHTESIQKLQVQIQELTTDIESLQKAKNQLKSQNESKTGEIELLLKQREQMAHLIELKADNIQKLKVSLIELDETYRNSIEEGAKKHEENKSVLLSQWSDERQALSLKVLEGFSHLQRKIELEEELKNTIMTSQDYKIRLQSEQTRVQNIMLENELLRKTIKELQEKFTSQLERELQLKFKFQQKEFDRLNAEIERISKDKLAITAQSEQTSQRLIELAGRTELLVDQNNRLQMLLKQNMQSTKQQVQFLKKANIQLQIQNQSIVQSSHSDSKIKSDLSQSVTALQSRNTYLQEYMSRTKSETACIISIFKQLKEERDLLIKKYIVLTNEVYKLNQKDDSLNRELNSFGEYFSRVAALHNQINKHLFNITHETQGTIVRFVTSTSPQPQSPSKMQESIINKIEN